MRRPAVNPGLGLDLDLAGAGSLLAWPGGCSGPFRLGLSLTGCVVSTSSAVPARR
jgi:hypothetical protein